MNKDFSSDLKIESRAIRFTLLAELIIVLISAINITYSRPITLEWGTFIGLIGIIAGIVLMGSYLWVRFSKQPEVSEKAAVAQEQQILEDKIAAMRQQISALEEDRAQIDKNEQAELAKRNTSFQEQTSDFSEKRLQQDITRRQTLQNALRNVQSEHIRNGLLNTKLSEVAHIVEAGASPNDTITHLAENQIYTANDIISEWLERARVPPSQQEALLAWRQQLEVDLQRTQPIRLDDEKIAAINQAFELQNSELEQEEMLAKVAVEKDLVEIREAVDKIRERNKSSVNVSRSALRGLQDKRNVLKKQQLSYERITFNQFFNLTLGVALGFGRNAYGIAASIVHTAVWGLLVLQIGLSIRAAQLIISGNNPQTIKASNREDISLPEDVACIPTTTPRQTGIVTRVIDGDTIEVQIEGEEYRVRYIGIDAPEPDQAFGGLAFRENVELVAGKEVTLIQDQSNTDVFGRLLRYVIVEDEFVNYLLVHEGYARTAAYAPDLACQSVFEAAQQMAQTQNVGLWTIVDTPQLITPNPEGIQPENLSGVSCSCGANTLNCSDFATQADAQACFAYCVSQGAGDIHRLDGNADGVACESLP